MNDIPREAYAKIAAYCDIHGEAAETRNHSIYVFMLVYDGVLDDASNGGTTNITKTRLQAISHSLLADEQIHGYVSRGREIRVGFQKSRKFGFFIQVLASILGGIALTTLAFFLYWSVAIGIISLPTPTTENADVPSTTIPSEVHSSSDTDNDETAPSSQVD